MKKQHNGLLLVVFLIILIFITVLVICITLLTKLTLLLEEKDLLFLLLSNPFFEHTSNGSTRFIG